VSTSKTPIPSAADDAAAVAGTAPLVEDAAGTDQHPMAEPAWDDATLAVPAADSELENPMWSEKTVLSSVAPPPASHPPPEPRHEAALRAGPDSRPLAATMAGPLALSTSPAAAEAVAVTVGNQNASPSAAARAVEPAVDGYLNSIVADRYKVLKKLGEGGMGTVYLAEHVIIEKKVALKVLSEDFARKADLVQRFMQEAKAASRIGHENIVDIHDFGETPSGSVFIAMEFLEGRDLATLIREVGALPFERTRQIVSQICRALGAAHAKGIIHRDMKPENVYLIEREGRADFVKILDFGIAKISSLDDGGGARLTRTGMIFGTPEYMSPEQARGDKPDQRVDIYAVGCILYEMLTGDVPFHADTFMGVLTKHMFEQPTPPSLFAPDKNIPPDAEAVVLRAISKDRDHRFQSMKEMSMALAACAGGSSEGWVGETSGQHDTPPTSTRTTLTTSVRSSPSVPAVGDPVIEPLPRSASSALRLTLGGIILVGGVAALTAFGVMKARVRPPRPEPTAATTVPAAPVAKEPAPAPPPVAPAVPAPAQATITINTTPVGAEVLRDKAVLGLTPYSMKVASSGASITLVLRKKEFKDRSVDVTPDRDHSYEFDLIPVRKSGTHTTARPAPAALPPAPAPPPRTSPPPRPAGRLRDLKDPFSDEPAKPKR
jgi:serine/threonine-protein kinase